MKPTRFIVEGQWSGYTNSQRRIVHRTIHKVSQKTLFAWVKKNYSIRFTDGTVLMLSVRYCKPREQVKEINGYVSLIRQCVCYDVNSVAELPKETFLNG